MQLRPDTAALRGFAVPLLLAIGIVALWLVVIFLFNDTWHLVLSDIQAMQRDLQGGLADATRLIAENGAGAAWTLIGLSFAYGALHSAGPGHGKLVISTYLLTNEGAVRRSLMLSIVAAMMQGVTAIVIIEVVLAIIGAGVREATGIANKLEMTSYALVAVLGLILAGVTARRLVSRARDPHAADACGTCGHVHAPDMSHISDKGSLGALAAVIFSIGLRPCTGAILVLILANVLGLRFTAWAAVFAMSAGAALTVSAIALASVYARRATLRAAERWPRCSGRLPIMLDGIAFCGGVLIIALGVSLLQSAATIANHPLL
ncbi:MAG: nickel/cobalt transporter [Alphaproteobacteria bacterium]